MISQIRVLGLIDTLMNMNLRQLTIKHVEDLDKANDYHRPNFFLKSTNLPDMLQN